MPGSRVVLVTALVAALAVLAGCNGLDLGERRGVYEVPDRTTTAPTTTGTGPDEDRVNRDRTTIPPVEPPAEDPDGRIVIGKEAVAPGVSTTAVRDPDRLANAHLEALFWRSFRVRLNHTVRYPNGSRRVIDTAADVSANRSRYAIDRRIIGADGNRSWMQVRSTGYDVYLSITGDGPGRDRYDEPGASTVPPRNCTPVSLPDPSFHGTIERAFEATGTTSVRQSERSPDRYRITATGVDAGLIAPGATDVRNLTVRAVVDARGVVRYLRISYRARTNATPVAVTTTLRVYDVGTAVVPPQPLEGPRVVQVPTGGPGQCGDPQ